MYCYRIKKYIGSYLAALNGADAVVFTAGIGENSSKVRSKICKDMDFLGISIDEDKNKNKETIISNGKVSVMIVPTNEELAIAQETVRVLKEVNQKKALEKEAVRLKKELDKLSEADKANIAIIKSQNDKLSCDEIIKIIDKEKGIKISSDTLKELLDLMGL